MTPKQILMCRYFATFYLSINLGSILSFLVVPIIRANYGYPVAFGTLVVGLLTSAVVFWSGRHMYLIEPPAGSMLPRLFKRAVIKQRMKLLAWCASRQQRFVHSYNPLDQLNMQRERSTTHVACVDDVDLQTGSIELGTFRSCAGAKGCANGGALEESCARNDGQDFDTTVLMSKSTLVAKSKLDETRTSTGRSRTGSSSCAKRCCEKRGERSSANGCVPECSEKCCANNGSVPKCLEKCCEKSCASKHNFEDKSLHHPIGALNQRIEEERDENNLTALWAVLKFLAAFPCFWMLYDQQGAAWNLQAQRMDTHGITWLRPESMMVFNPICIVLFIPFFHAWVFPLVAKWHRALSSDGDERGMYM
jgi:hypothetical protein